MNRKTVFALVGLLVIALAAVGVGYGLWFEDLKIHGDVQTGELDVDWSGPFLFQYFDIYGPDGRVHQAFPEEKQGEVYCDAAVGNNLVHDLAEFPADLEGQDDPNTLLIKVGGAYPSYHCLVIGNMVNTGTVPVHVAWWWQEYYPGVKFFMFPVDAASLDGFESDLAALAESDQMQLTSSVPRAKPNATPHGSSILGKASCSSSTSTSITSPARSLILARTKSTALAGCSASISGMSSHGWRSRSQKVTLLALPRYHTGAVPHSKRHSL